MKNGAESLGDQMVGEYAAVLTVFEVSQLNNFSNNPLHSRAKQGRGDANS
jgi:hypothetical protein